MCVCDVALCYLADTPQIDNVEIENVYRQVMGETPKLDVLMEMLFKAGQQLIVTVCVMGCGCGRGCVVVVVVVVVV